jgi:CDP-diacylglycerol pyrophosphatase
MKTMRQFPRKFCAAMALLGAGLLTAWQSLADPDALWHIVHDQCVPHMMQNASTAPCAAVDLAQGEARGDIVLKDIRGVLQYLLIPTARVTGIEDPAILQSDAPDYWGQAWAARSFMSQRRGSDVPREAVSLTVNSSKGRTQNQLHIHISCVQFGLRELLMANEASIASRWSPLPVELNGHAYLARRIDGADLAGVQPFKLLADDVPQAREHMGDYTLAVVATHFADGKEGFVLLAGKADPASGNRGSAEGDVQDHDCTVLSR